MIPSPEPSGLGSILYGASLPLAAYFPPAAIRVALPLMVRLLPIQYLMSSSLLIVTLLIVTVTP